MSFLDSFNNAYSYDDLLIWAMVVLYGMFWLIVCLGLIIHHFLLAVPLYIMADKAGYAYPFLAFIPFANYYLMHILPIKEYNYIGMYKTYERKDELAQMAIGTLLDIAAYHLHPVCAGYLRHVGYAQGRVSPRYDPSGCSRSSISWCYDRRTGATGGPATGAIHLYLW